MLDANLYNLIIGIVGSLIATMIVAGIGLLWRKLHQKPDQEIAPSLLFTALQKYKKDGPSLSPALLDVKIPLEYVDMTNPLNRSNSILDIYRSDENEIRYEDMLLLGKTGSGKSTSLRELDAIPNCV